jgi:hypothetical protein
MHNIERNKLQALDEATKKSGSSKGNSFIGSDWLEVIQGKTMSDMEGVLDNLKDFLSQLTFEQHLAVTHIIISISIITCIVNIILAIYSDFLLTYFKIEDKFPKFGRLIKIRRKYLHFYLI